MARLETFPSHVQIVLEEGDRVLEVGRQTGDDPGPPAVISKADFARLIVAARSQTEFGRYQFKIEVTSSDQIRLTNVNQVNSAFVAANAVLGPGESMELQLPARVSRGNIALVIARGDAAPTLDKPATFQSLVPGVSFGASRSKDLSRPAADWTLVASIRNSNAEMMFERLGQLVLVLQQAASIEDFASHIAATTKDMVQLDRAAVLVWDKSCWRVEALSEQRRSVDINSWLPSQSLLGVLLRDRRTVWGSPSSVLTELSESIAKVVEVVAAPILDGTGEVIGAVYGERRIARELDRSSIDHLDAKMVELMACGVGGGWARVAQEQSAIARRVQLERFVTKEIAGRLEVDPDLLIGRDAEVTMLFCGIAGFSRIAALLSPQETFEWISAVMGALTKFVLATNGTLVDYIGDEIIAMWGAPLPIANHASAAAETALMMLESLKVLNRELTLPGGESTQVGIGLNSGIVRVGNTGSEHKLKYGPLGSPVNIASRVQGATRYFRTPALITGETAALIGEDFSIRRLCSVRLKNIDHPVELFELAANPEPTWKQFAADYETALTAWETGNLQSTIKILSQLVAQGSDDGPTMVMLARAVDAWRDQREFDPVWTLPSK